MKLKRSQKLMLVLIVLAVILAVTAAAVAFSGAGARTRPLFTGSARLAGPESDIEAALEDEAHNVWENVPRIHKLFQPFWSHSSRLILSGHKGENRVYSPVNLTVALAMTAEITGGETRGQIEKAVGASLEDLRESSRQLWVLNAYSGSGGETQLANSLWLNNSIEYKQKTLDILADSYFAESFRGDPGTAGYDALLREWTSEKTHDLLGTGGLNMDPETVLELMSTVYFNSCWSKRFPEDCTSTRLFHSPEGGIECEFMDNTSRGIIDHFYRDPLFTAASLGLSDGSSMTFILPREDSSIDQVLSEDSGLWEFFRWIVSRRDEGSSPWGDESLARINFIVPKFDVSFQSELSETLTDLGISDAFDPRKSNFDPLTLNNIPIYISRINHAARVMIDENGCTAASYVEAGFAGAGDPPRPEAEIDFILDRPFIFLIQSQNSFPLFIGLVNHP